MLTKNILRYTILLPAIFLLQSCNSNNKKKIRWVEQPPTLKMLSHFKESTAFPVVIDSSFIANVSKGDSLGTKEIKKLAQKWFNDSLTEGHQYDLQDFYTIDSVKAKHVFEKWEKKLDIGMTNYANAYAVEKVTLADSTVMLVWALHLVSYPACPSSDITNIYFTFYKYNNTFGQTFLLGSILYGADAPMVGQTIISGTLVADGSLQMEERGIVKDFDSLTADLHHTHYEYLIKHDSIAFKNKMEYPIKHVKFTPLKDSVE